LEGEDRAMTRIPLLQVVEYLQAHYGQPKVPRPGGPWEMILWENVVFFPLARILADGGLIPLLRAARCRCQASSSKRGLRRAATRARWRTLIRSATADSLQHRGDFYFERKAIF